MAVIQTAPFPMLRVWGAMGVGSHRDALLPDLRKENDAERGGKDERMGRLIDADYVLSALGIFHETGHNDQFMYGIKTAREIVENAPTLEAEPIYGGRETPTPWIVCGQCTKKLERQFMFCPRCGRKVRWDG